MIPARSVVLGLHGSPIWTQERGIARYEVEHIRGLVQVAPRAIAQVDVEPGTSLPAGLEAISEDVRFKATGTVPSGSAAWPVYHVMSPFDLVPVDRIWPEWARDPRVGLVVTLYDLIPLIFSDIYLTDSGQRAAYGVRCGMLRAADAVLAISRGTADDAIRHLDLDPDRLFVIGAGCAEVFQPATRDRSETLLEIGRDLPAIRSGYFLYTGGSDHRKNLERLVEAYGQIPQEVRRQHQFVLAGAHLRSDRRSLMRVARDSGVGRELIFTDRVPDRLLVLLYQACLGFVFPSVYEGFGLPALEAMSCGAAVIASDIPAMRELVSDAEARFDPTSPAAIVASMLALIRNPGLVARLQRQGAATALRYTWASVARRTLGAYESAQLRRKVRSSANGSRAWAPSR